MVSVLIRFSTNDDVAKREYCTLSNTSAQVWHTHQVGAELTLQTIGVLDNATALIHHMISGQCTATLHLTCGRITRHLRVAVPLKALLGTISVTGSPLPPRKDVENRRVCPACTLLCTLGQTTTSKNIKVP